MNFITGIHYRQVLFTCHRTGLPQFFQKNLTSIDIHVMIIQQKSEWKVEAPFSPDVLRHG